MSDLPSPFGDYTGVLPGLEIIDRFTEIVYEYYGEWGRKMPWRETDNPYEILVSEVMLQQTQVSRVLPKYREFLSRWPDVAGLAAASFREVLELWQGLGYNRRGRALHEAAKLLVERHGGEIPADLSALLALPGVGASTAAAIRSFAWGHPAVYLETNVRRVYLYFFFQDRERVHDREILAIAALALDREDSRSWSYALIDYGVYLKSLLPNPNRRSAGYTRQAPFEGSDRQIRGRILALLVEAGSVERSRIESLPFDRDRIARCTRSLLGEGMVGERGGRYYIPDSPREP